MTIPVAVIAAAGAGLGRRRPGDDHDEENEHVPDAGADRDNSGSSGSSDPCLAIVPVLRARFPHAQPHRLPLVVHGRAASHHIHFLMDEFEDEDYFGSYGLDLDEFGRVACRALVLHPTKHKSGGGQQQQQQHHKAPPRASVDSLPRETLGLIFRFLPAPALCTAEMVCPLWRSIAAQDDAWWASLCEAQFGVSPDSFTPPPDPSKVLYMLQHASLRSIKYGSGGGGGARAWARFF